MMRQRTVYAGRRLLAASVLGLLALALPARAADEDNRPESLKLVPANADVYVTWLGLGGHWKAVKESRAWARLESMFQGSEVRGGLYAELKKPENRELADLLGEMLSEEFFFHLGGLSDALLVVKEINRRALREYPSRPKGGKDEKAFEKRQTHAALETLQEQRERIKVPDMVVGFRVGDPRRARAQLGRVEGWLEQAARRAKDLRGRVERHNVASGDFVTLTLDVGKAVQGEQYLREAEKRPGEFRPLLDRLRGMKLTVSAGVRGRWVLLAAGESTAVLRSLGSAEALAGRPELKPLARHVGRRLCRVRYVSRSFSAAFTTGPEDVEAFVSALAGSVGELGLKGEEKQRRLREDIAELGRQIKARVAEPGASISFSFLTDKGVEGYGYDWARYPDGRPAPLAMLHHVGGSPLVAVAGRWADAEADYRLLAALAGRALHSLGEFTLQDLKGADRREAERAFGKLRPLLKRLDAVTRELLLPSVTGHYALVLDTQHSARQWHRAMPAAERPLPLIEPAVVVGLKDPDRFRKALAEYRQLFNQVAEVFREAARGAGKVEIPKAATRELKGRGTLCYYGLPRQWGLDERILLGVAVGEKAAAFALTAEMAERLITPTPPRFPGPAAQPGRPLLAAVYVDTAGLARAVSNWVEYGVKTGMDLFEVPKDQQRSVLKQVHAGLEVLTVLHNYSSATYAEDGARVTHYVLVLRDLGAKKKH